eukprot:NODE_7693_length_749_cov_70.020767_g7443_i0.p1 GENE.NODE_7693_length_749_cov_70.020767_g7443_i0~~NODE_7693_length_749_cov_70.020767_g7443_i0.p1  ORF type:complete len:222 (+),score=29.77 NODE_7693_length_749_cov_70.020767_g7443_i0:85-666(+)
MADFYLTDDSKGTEDLQTFDCLLCLDSLQLLPDMEAVKKAIEHFWHHVKLGGHLIIDIPNTLPVDKGPGQTYCRIDLVRENLNRLGSQCLLEEGCLDVVQRSYRDKGRRVHEWYGFAQQYSKQRKVRYYSNWTEQFDEIMFGNLALESLLEAGGFDIVATYGNQQGAEFDYRSSDRRFLVAKRKFMGSPAMAP